jgi:hypothetical protein
MGRRIGAGSGQRFAVGSQDQNVTAAKPLKLTPSSLPMALSVLRLRLAALLAAQLFDYATFTVMVGHHGIEAEANPVVARGFIAFGLPLVAAGKGALIVFLGSVLVILARAWSSGMAIRRIATLVALLAVAGGMAGGVSNVLVH